MKALLIYIAVINTLAALITVNTTPGAPRKPQPSARQLMVTLLIEIGMVCWSLWLLWSLP
jgi:hypothetical protein